jgi:hypothetical protein
MVRQQMVLHLLRHLALLLLCVLWRASIAAGLYRHLLAAHHHLLLLLLLAVAGRYLLIYLRLYCSSRR